MILQIIFAILMFALAIVVHEIAHIIVLSNYIHRMPALRFNKKERCFSVGYPEDYESLNKEEYRNVLWAGIIAGAGPLFFLPWFSLFSFGLLYVWGCRHDIKNALK